MTALALGLLAAAAVIGATGPWPDRPLGAVTPIPSHLLRRAAAVALLLGGAVVAPPLVPVAVGGRWVHRRLRARRRQRAELAAVRRALPDTVDLLRLATTAGLSLALAHPLVARNDRGRVGEALRAAAEASDRGVTRADALVASLSPLGERARALADVLGDHLRYGVPLLPGLDRIGLELRLDRRRAAELEARRVPVRLLGPLVTCTLPAFALLTVVPLLVASLEALPL